VFAKVYEFYLGKPSSSRPSFSKKMTLRDTFVDDNNRGLKQKLRSDFLMFFEVIRLKMVYVLYKLLQKAKFKSDI